MAYDQASGTVTVKMSFYDPAYWVTHAQGEEGNIISEYGTEVDLSDKCAAQDPPGKLSVTMTPKNSAASEDSDQFGDQWDTASGYATLAGYRGGVQGQGSFDGSTYTLTVQSPYFAGHDYRCAELAPQNGDSYGWEYFPGWAPTDLTRQNATAAFAALLPAGAQAPAAEGAYCPEVLDGEAQPWSQCFAEYKLAGRWHIAQGQATQTSLAPTATVQRTSSWTRKWARCSLRDWPIPGKLASNNNCGNGAPQSDVYFVAQEMWWGSKRTGRLLRARQAGWQFVDSAGFGSIGTYRCTHASRTVTCTNRVGDSFRYTP